VCLLAYVYLEQPLESNHLHVYTKTVMSRLLKNVFSFISSEFYPVTDLHELMARYSVIFQG